jgi:hypothetical protein
MEAARDFLIFILERWAGPIPPPLLSERDPVLMQPPMELLWDIGMREGDQDIGPYLPYWKPSGWWWIVLIVGSTRSKAVFWISNLPYIVDSYTDMH